MIKYKPKLKAVNGVKRVILILIYIIYAEESL